MAQIIKTGALDTLKVVDRTISKLENNLKVYKKIRNSLNRIVSGHFLTREQVFKSILKPREKEVNTP